MITLVEYKRRRINLIQKALAVNFGISGGMLCKIENRERIASPELRCKMAKFFGISENILFDKDGYAKEF